MKIEEVVEVTEGTLLIKEEEKRKEKKVKTT